MERTPPSAAEDDLAALSAEPQALAADARGGRIEGIALLDCVPWTLGTTGSPA